MKELNDNQRQLNMNNNNRWRKMIAQWSVEQEILRTTIHFGVIDEHLILQLVARIMLWFKIILLRFALINIIIDKCPLIALALNYNYTI